MQDEDSEDYSVIVDISKLVQEEDRRSVDGDDDDCDNDDNDDDNEDQSDDNKD